MAKLYLGGISGCPVIIVNGNNDQTSTSSIPTTFGSRIDNKATVVGVLDDHEGNNYVLAVADAVYRSSSAMAWSSSNVDTSLSNANTDKHSGEYNTNLILSTQTISNYPAFNFARNACTLYVGNTIYHSALPNIIELRMLYNNKELLDQYDPTVSEYSSRSMSTFKCGGSWGLWSSCENGSSNAWLIFYTSSLTNDRKTNGNDYGVCPVFCIPLS